MIVRTYVMMSMLLVFCVLCVEMGTASPFSPHVVKKAPFFEGWFVRVVDHENEYSFATVVGFGSFEGNEEESSKDQTWTALLRDDGENQVTLQNLEKSYRPNITVNGGDPVTKNPKRGSPSVWSWISNTITIRVNDSTAYVEANFDDVRHYFFCFTQSHAHTHTHTHTHQIRITANLSNREPWNPEKPNTAGPEGVFSLLPLPCHYYVQSLGSNATYEVFDRSKSTIVRRGTGLAHMEANYGSFFPTSWIWSQTISDNVRLLLTGGKFLIGPIVTDSYIIAFRDRERSWNFHTTLHTDVVNVNFDACAGTLSLVAHHRFSFSSSELRVNISADPTSFSDPLYFPQRSVGFTNKPGCVESYVVFEL